MHLSFHALLGGAAQTLAIAEHSSGLLLSGDLLFGGILLMACSAYLLRRSQRQRQR